MQRVLVTYGTRSGSTAGIAQRIADTLREDGLETEVLPPDEVADVAPYDAVVLGGALYMNRWHKDARRFSRRHARALREKPVWLFSSGPLDASASERDIPAVPTARRAERRTHARGHATFGGSLEEGAKGHLARSILEEGRGGDFRDTARIERWAHEVADELKAPPEGV
ncbi:MULTISPECIES: flavodoxin domain-containing protein [Streptomyces]|uniref:Flavodoxin n=2 Tax=Streptomyces TaxID=1883 RepID=A0A1D8GA26_9ACTN|nr:MULTISPECIES: flavodoxin domain-containing protein [Streptomyces]AOT62282.1 Flavodoxin [Streptomyces rubrolavendulae]KAF0647342.1 hypothetical protein K701_23770 [Streptomyces fradiae ATCC 10745 = DSM 40063]OSY48829.1 Flavodoxin [Streptomyces fradiae ATCC 10745 = DSM 40063]QEV15108.1 flavodoxin [Streptomyces fradiae ATCC 10745 = DSM 40063]UQS29940.1 flavodoxin domain-containing protein [Streptomyces fradiae]